MAFLYCNMVLVFIAALWYHPTKTIRPSIEETKHVEVLVLWRLIGVPGLVLLAKCPTTICRTGDVVNVALQQGVNGPYLRASGPKTIPFNG